MIEDLEKRFSTKLTLKGYAAATFLVSSVLTVEERRGRDKALKGAEVRMNTWFEHASLHCSRSRQLSSALAWFLFSSWQCLKSMPDVKTWKNLIALYATWLSDPDACPTKNAAIAALQGASSQPRSYTHASLTCHQVYTSSPSRLLSLVAMC